MTITIQCEVPMSGIDYDGRHADFGDCGAPATWLFEVVGTYHHPDDDDSVDHVATCDEHRLNADNVMPGDTITCETPLTVAGVETLQSEVHVGDSVALHVWGGSGFTVHAGTVQAILPDTNDPEGSKVLALVEDDARMFSLNDVHSITGRKPMEVDMDAICEVVRAAGFPAYVEMTGGGVQTIYAGRPFQDNRYPAVAGPGSVMGRRPVGHLFDFHIGLDDEGETEGYDCTADDTEAGIAERLVALCRAARYRIATQAGPGASSATVLYDSASGDRIDVFDRRRDAQGWADRLNAGTVSPEGVAEALANARAEATWEREAYRSTPS